MVRDSRPTLKNKKVTPDDNENSANNEWQRQHVLFLPFISADHLAESFQDIILFNSQNNHMSSESLGSMARVWVLEDLNPNPSQPVLLSVLCCLPKVRSGCRATADILGRGINVAFQPFDLQILQE